MKEIKLQENSLLANNQIQLSKTDVKNENTMKKRTIKKQVEECLIKEIEKHKKNGHEFLRFQDLVIETDNHIIKCQSPYWGNYQCYEEKIAWKFLRKNYEYDKYYLVGFNGNSKFFKL